MNPLSHTPHPSRWLIALLLLMMMFPVAGAGLLDRVMMRLQHGQIHGVGIHQFLRHGHDVADETLEEVGGHAFADDDT
jgi:hypothetical protein